MRLPRSLITGGARGGDDSMIHDFNPAIATTPLGALYWYGAVYSLGFAGINGG